MEQPSRAFIFFNIERAENWSSWRTCGFCAHAYKIPERIFAGEDLPANFGGTHFCQFSTIVSNEDFDLTLADILAISFSTILSERIGAPPVERAREIFSR